VNAVCWAPHSAVHLCSAGDDCQALIWDLALSGAMGGQQQVRRPAGAGFVVAVPPLLLVVLLLAQRLFRLRPQCYC